MCFKANTNVKKSNLQFSETGVEQEEEVVIENIEEPVLEKEGEPSMDAGGAGSFSSHESTTETNQSVSEPTAPPMVPSIKNIDENPTITKLSFNDYDSVMNDEDRVESVNAPKTIERLEEISTERAIQRKLEEEAEDMEDRIKIHTDDVVLDNIFDFDNIGGNIKTVVEEAPIIEFETL